jgi:hypothetical protein
MQTPVLKEFPIQQSASLQILLQHPRQVQFRNAQEHHAEATSFFIDGLSHSGNDCWTMQL